jgi:hypothetical protein
VSFAGQSVGGDGSVTANVSVSSPPGTTILTGGYGISFGYVNYQLKNAITGAIASAAAEYLSYNIYSPSLSGNMLSFTVYLRYEDDGGTHVIAETGSYADVSVVLIYS